MYELVTSVGHETEPATEEHQTANKPPRAPRRRRTHVLRELIRSPGLVVSFALILGVSIAAIAPALFTGDDPLRGVPTESLQAPGADHWFGTDQVGRDLFARVVHGAGLSLRSAVLAVVVALVVGSLIGLIAGFLGSWIDDVVMRFVDVLLAIPSLLLALAVVSVLGFGTINIAIAVGVVGVASFARVMRSQVLKVRTAAYVEAARAFGVRWHTIILRHVLPNASGPVIALSTLEFGTALLAISALSFLGYGNPPPSPEWGALIAEGRAFLASSWWLTTFPGLAIAAVVLSANRISRLLDRQGTLR